MATGRFRGGRQFLLSILLAVGGGGAGSAASDFYTIGITRLGNVDPTLGGAGGRGGLAGGEGATKAWQVNPVGVGQPTSLFTYFSSDGSSDTFPNSLGLESGHANGVGNLYFGVPAGVAPSVTHVDNYEADYFYTGIVTSSTPVPIGARVINQSFI